MSAPNWQGMSTVNTAAGGRFQVEGMIEIFEAAITSKKGPERFKYAREEYETIVMDGCPASQARNRRSALQTLGLLKTKTPVDLAARALECIVGMADAQGWNGVSQCVYDIYLDGRYWGTKKCVEALRQALEAAS